MTIPSERTRAVIKARKLLLAILHTPVSKWNKKEIKNQIAGVLRHYPTSLDFSDDMTDNFSSLEFDSNRDKDINSIVEMLSKK